jgi:hypothetical protein
MDGTLISKGGVMTGGMSRNLESRAQRWDEKATGGLKEVPFRTTSRCLILCCCASHPNCPWRVNVPVCMLVLCFDCSSVAPQLPPVQPCDSRSCCQEHTSQNQP